MPLVPETFLDELRERLPVSAVVGTRVKLRKEGGEFRAIEDASLTVNDNKKLWWDHSKNKGGDIFAWMMEGHGLDFHAAVEECAKMAGMALPKNDGAQSHRNGGDDAPPWGEDPPPAEPDERFRSVKPKREIVETYDYTDAQGGMLYEVCRMQYRMPDGGWELGKKGKPKKDFMQRRRGPDGSWITGLGAGEFIRGRNGDWYKATQDKIENWKGAERRTFNDGVDHGLYRLIEFNEEKSADEPVFIPEGERKVDAFREWGLVATCNSGGAGNWRPEHAEMFRGLDVIIPIDNDDAGKKRGETIARSLRGIAGRVRVLNFADGWPAAPIGADVIDWRKDREGTVDELRELVAALPDWQPKPYASKFGLIMWGEQAAKGEDYEYIVEDLIPKREGVLLIGESQSGKSFLTSDMGMCGARGLPFFGHRVFASFGVVYCAYEGGKGYHKRMQAYAQHHGIDPAERIPFAVLTKPIDLWSAEINTDQLIEEILGVSETMFGGVELGAVVIDTHNRANPGASEIESKDIGRIIDRYQKIMERTKAGVWIIGHKNAAGKHRGNEQIYNNIETVIDISRETKTEGKETYPIKDDSGRVIRRATVIKQREGEDGKFWQFVVPQVSVGTNRYGKPKTSCVATRPYYKDEQDGISDRATTKSRNSLKLPDQATVVLKALVTALSEHGVKPPPSLGLPKSVASVCTWHQWRDEYRKVAEDATEAAVKGAMYRAGRTLFVRSVIGRDTPWIWLTGRSVKHAVTGHNHYGAQETADTPTNSDEAHLPGLDGDMPAGR